MSDERRWEYYLYPWPQGVRIIPLILTPIFMVAVLASLCGLLASLGSPISTSEGSMSVTGKFVRTFVMTKALWGVFSAASAFPNVRVAEDGLAIRFLFHWWFVPWADVVEVTSTTSIAAPGSIVRLVRVKKLTILHQYLALTSTFVWRGGQQHF
jgi:hypothetical protein